MAVFTIVSISIGAKNNDLKKNGLTCKLLLPEGIGLRQEILVGQEDQEGQGEEYERAAALNTFH